VPSISLTPSVTPSVTPPVSISLTPAVTPSASSTGPAYNFYNMNRYVCSGAACSLVENILVATLSNITSLTRYYLDNNTADIYKKTSDASYGIAYILDTATFNTNCNILCSV
jgi:hypothetical protein